MTEKTSTNEDVRELRNAISLYETDCIVDSIHAFQRLIDKYPESDLADDAWYNMALCYYKIDQFQKSIELLQSLIVQNPNGTICEHENGVEHGMLAAKAYHLIASAYLCLDDPKSAKDCLESIKRYKDSFIEVNGKKLSFTELTEQTLKTYYQLQGKG